MMCCLLQAAPQASRRSPSSFSPRSRLLLLVDSAFTRNPGEYVAVVLMAAAGGLIISAAQDLLVIFVGLELLSSASTSSPPSPSNPAKAPKPP